MKCCFESKCSMDNTDNDIPDEINENLENVIYKLKNNLDESNFNSHRRKSI